MEKSIVPKPCVGGSIPPGGTEEPAGHDDLRRAIASSVALETARGWRIAKNKTSHKIDVVVALALASLATIEARRYEDYPTVIPISITRESPWRI